MHWHLIWWLFEHHHHFKHIVIYQPGLPTGCRFLVACVPVK